MYRWLALIIIVLALTALPVWRRAARGGPALLPTCRCTRLAGALAALGALGLALTGFISAIALGEPLAEWLLLIHTTAAGLFLFGLTMLVFLGAGAIVRAVAANPCAGTLPFWLLAWSGVIAAFSALFMMTPIFGSTGSISFTAPPRSVSWWAASGGGSAAPRLQNPTHPEPSTP
jgi:hypothetical protein